MVFITGIISLLNPCVPKTLTHLDGGYQWVLG